LMPPSPAPHKPPRPPAPVSKLPPPPLPRASSNPRPPPPLPKAASTKRPPPPLPKVASTKRPPPPLPTAVRNRRPPPPLPTAVRNKRPPPLPPRPVSNKRPPPPLPVVRSKRRLSPLASPIPRPKAAPAVRKLLSSAAGAGAGAATASFTSGVPAVVDWRLKNVVTKVRDQGPCQYCWVSVIPSGILCAGNAGLNMSGWVANLLRPPLYFPCLSLCMFAGVRCCGRRGKQVSDLHWPDICHSPPPPQCATTARLCKQSGLPGRRRNVSLRQKLAACFLFSWLSRRSEPLPLLHCQVEVLPVC
jgi:hypothetical protein